MSGRLDPENGLEAAWTAARLCLARTLLALHHALEGLATMSQLLSLRSYVNADSPPPATGP